MLRNWSEGKCPPRDSCTWGFEPLPGRSRVVLQFMTPSTIRPKDAGSGLVDVGVHDYPGTAWRDDYITKELLLYTTNLTFFNVGFPLRECGGLRNIPINPAVVKSTWYSTEDRWEAATHYRTNVVSHYVYYSFRRTYLGSALKPMYWTGLPQGQDLLL